MKRLIFCFDGTWNRIDSEYPTNVAKLAQMVAHRDGETSQLIYYDEGVGTDQTSQWTGGIFGHGLFDNIVAAYHFLLLNHEAGDEIYVFGFSRGAYTARSFVGLIRNAGIISRRSLRRIGDAIALYKDRTPETKPGAEKIREFRYLHRPELVLPGDIEWRARRYPKDDRPVRQLRVRYLGVWDTVGALGIPAQIAPDEYFRREYQFHDSELSSFVEAARHAVAADERRRTFDGTLWNNLDLLNGERGPHKYLQMIFPGAHGSVGGGGLVTGLSDEALLWVLEGARAQGLAIDTDADSPIHMLRPDHRAALINNDQSWTDTVKEFLMGIGFDDRSFGSIDITQVHDSLIRRFHEPAAALPEGEAYRPKSLKPLWHALGDEGPKLVATGRKAVADAPLRTPVRVDAHVIEAGDTLSKLAARCMGGAKYANLLFRHNQMLGRLHDPDRIHVGQEIEIPVYEGKPPAGE
jgi:uncharacterized protein (DUF2235 family)